MDRNENGKGYDDAYDDFYTGVNIGSRNECTGMIPSPPMTDEAQEGYADIFPIPQQRATGAAKADSAEEQRKRSSVKG